MTRQMITNNNVQEGRLSGRSPYSYGYKLSTKHNGYELNMQFFCRFYFYMYNLNIEHTIGAPYVATTKKIKRYKPASIVP